MKGLYIDLIDVKESPSFIGVKNKINGQIKAMRDLGISVDNITINDKFIVINGEKQKDNVGKYKSSFLNANTFFYILKNKYLNYIINYDYIYIRFNFANIEMARFIKKLSKYKKKVFIEIPTYPYLDEYDNNIKDNTLKKIDKLAWSITRKYVYRIIVTNEMKNVFGVKTINIFNGVDIDSVPKVATSNLGENDINLIGVANINKWHGYDRVIKGLYEYYKLSGKKNVKFYIVGDGIEKNSLEDLTEKLNIKDKVIFVGVKQGKELDEIFNSCHIGVSSLALFRAGGGHDPIKSKEYVCRGLPVLIGYNDIALSNENDFVIKVKSNDMPIDIENIINKYNEIISTTDDIRAFGELNLSWKSQMKKVIEVL